MSILVRMVFPIGAALAIAFSLGTQGAGACPKDGKDGGCPHAAAAEGEACPHAEAGKCPHADAGKGCAGDCQRGKDGQCSCGGEGKDCGCKDGAGCAQHKAAAAGAKPPSVPKEMVGQEVVCPVTGERFKVTEQTLTSEYEGKTYYFCCPGCKPKFDKAPAKYVKK